MVKLRILSDLHLDHRKDPAMWLAGLPRVECDAVIVAGDLSDGNQLLRSLDTLCRWLPDQPILYVPGNHDYWGGPDLAGQAMWTAENRHPHLKCLVRESYKLKDITIAGATGWYTGEAIPADRRILGPGTTEWINDQAEDDWLFLQDNPAEVIVTHHLPHRRSCDERFSAHHGWLAHHLEDLVGIPHAMWIHGHTHTAKMYTERGTNVVCNPAGYPGENTGWKEDLVVDADREEVRRG